MIHEAIGFVISISLMIAFIWICCMTSYEREDFKYSVINFLKKVFKR